MYEFTITVRMSDRVYAALRYEQEVAGIVEDLINAAEEWAKEKAEEIYFYAKDEIEEEVNNEQLSKLRPIW